MSKKIASVSSHNSVSSDQSELQASTPTNSSTALMDPPLPPPAPNEEPAKATPRARKHRAHAINTAVRYFTPAPQDENASNRQAELFYLQKQIQLQTQMVFILEDGARVQGVIEWYDRNSIKVRGKSRLLIYKSAVKYLYKAGEIGSAPEE
jgi:sRNA-binding regulator protein Hfq